jgi:predicted ferric reductase
MIMLAARIPIIDRTVGHDRAIAVHRSLGVVITSLVAVRRKFSYEGWHLVHLLSYVAVLFAVSHQLSVGGILSAGSVERVYWIALYVLAFGSITTYRFIEPLVSTIRHPVRVSRVENVAHGVVSIHFSGRNLRSLDVSGGQFFIWRFWTARSWWHSHPISLSSVPIEDAARITVRRLGTGSSAISAVRPGARVSLEGPYGVFADAARTAPKLAIMVAGIGITPVRAFLEDARVQPGGTTILLRASSQDETYLWNEISKLAREKGARVYTMVGKRARSGPGWMPQADASRGVTLRSIFPDLKNSDLYICGPTAWLDRVEHDARTAGIPEHQLHTERFDW